MASKTVPGRIWRDGLTNQFLNKEILLFAFALTISLILHIIITLSVYYPGNFITMPLTAGMIFSWLYTSSIIKDSSSSHKNFSFKIILSKIYPVFKYILLFLGLYAVINFVNTFSPQTGKNWVDFELDYNKLRGISGFWLFFYTLGLYASILKVKFFNKDQ